MIPTWPFENRYHNLFSALGLDPYFRVRWVGTIDERSADRRGSYYPTQAAPTTNSDPPDTWGCLPYITFPLLAASPITSVVSLLMLQNMNYPRHSIRAVLAAMGGMVNFSVFSFKLTQLPDENLMVGDQQPFIFNCLL
jgi:hypothetical protein